MKNKTWIIFVLLINVIINFGCNSLDEQDGSKKNNELYEQHSQQDTSLSSKLSLINKKFEDTSTKAEALIELDSLLNDTIQFRRILNAFEKSNPELLQEIVDKTMKTKMNPELYSLFEEAYEKQGTKGVLDLYNKAVPSNQSERFKFWLEKWKPQKRPR